MKNITKVDIGILVDGVYQYPIKPTYFIKMIVSLGNLPYEDQQKDFEEIKNEYISKLVDEGLVGNDKGTITEDLLAYGMLSYEGEGTILDYKTTSVDMVEKLLLIKSPGVSRSDAMLWVTISDEERAEYAKKAFENAKEKATRLATNVGKEIGEPIFIEDIQSQPFMEGFYYNERLDTRDYTITVSFEIK